MFFRKEQVKCEKCRHYVDKVDCKVVIKRFDGFGYYSPSYIDRYYCLLCKPEYNFVEGDRYYKTIPEHRVRVNKDGSDYKEVKTKKSKAKSKK